MKQIVSIFAHPRIRHSKVHKKLIKPLLDHPHVIVRDLYELYPDFIIQVPAEQSILKLADVIIFQFPIHWYSTPAILKEWIDSVLTPEFAFSIQGKELQGKYLWPVLSCGASEESYRCTGSNKYDLKTYLLPLVQTAEYCGLTVFEPFIIYQANKLSEEALDKKVEEFSSKVDELAFGKIFTPIKLNCIEPEVKQE
jgi:glutathione-regulated potassium-efflux system ancillary protein KefF